MLDHSFVSLSFWLSLPKKLQQMANYDSRNTKQHDNEDEDEDDETDEDEEDVEEVVKLLANS